MRTTRNGRRVSTGRMYWALAAGLAGLLAAGGCEARSLRPTYAERDRQADQSVKRHDTDGTVRLTAYAIPAAQEAPRRRDVARRFPAGDPLALRVCCGAIAAEPGWEYVDPKGRVWCFDRDYRDGDGWGVLGKAGGGVWRDGATFPAFAETDQPGVYASERYRLEGYRFALPDGRYTVRLHFTETYGPSEGKAGYRIFDVAVNDRVVLPRLDVAAETGGMGRPLVKEFRGVEPKDGEIRIGFHAVKDTPLINGIEILGEQPLAKDFDLPMGSGTVPEDLPATPGTPVARVACGYETPLSCRYPLRRGALDAGQLWSETADYGRVGGRLARRQPAIRFHGGSAPGILHGECFGLTAYKFRVPNGVYNLRLHFADGFECNYKPGMRVFGLRVQGGRSTRRSTRGFAAAGWPGRPCARSAARSLTTGFSPSPSTASRGTPSSTASRSSAPTPAPRRRRPG